ncbi:MAG: hypothetical protein IVW57_05635 [Ktedonobacterales bacterium]|nr:hypothetical protein [Ktedonobacterales bacterium]
MMSHITATFRRRFANLPPEIQAQARADYRLFQSDPNYPGLHFHPVTQGKETLYSVYIGIHYRALARERNGDLYWFWIGYHTVYDAILAGR